MQTKLIIAALLIVLTMPLPAQVIVENININEVEDIRIVKVLVTQKFLSRKVVITIDYGQNIVWGGEGSRVLGEDGKMRTFNSAMHAINYMEKHGWEFFEALAITTGDNDVYHYYFRKREGKPQDPDKE